ncbi:hypothetical protein CcaverHIS002_0608150 [Cutaneotrichosporon cavernicola]|uniref:Hydantoinase n=1 Tax=Cutaneotrichosporon cavernicola TaxID=279322 RepID=A0AA48L9G2_9TREE|nr:uncharacterized protein CcaverHIS019_0607600 [Cutaneotrichosporon cavernicola]BEI86528.1 hypothetical protein CcaverHIS002_0608150 [Cutaneotrichosporon cavernicola]BEI94301.1 hypothetical protein CcaverHIS019_0607600 [Cutaneotrichosporon cavernicola]BEJ02078.1 hypothetical protein CcaverHIS631_0607600 [Cutaneotrichosporon cavernicola]BEJ09841.1 hypothetical protein CcaverHIS641_0607560 [Cutaneotrichosporon cavernicola]
MTIPIAPSPDTDAPLRIGVDVGGTNTDAVILDLTPGCVNPVLAACKAPTTPDVTRGIQQAVAAALDLASVDRRQIQAVAIGTTSFVNALIERDVAKLDRVGVIRLCGPFSRLCPPFSSFPYELRAVLEGPVFFAAGGLQVDGSEIASVDPLEIRAACAEMARLGVRSVAISGCYSPIDTVYRQEELVRDIVSAELPGAYVTISKDVGNIGLLERENASILNAALRTFAARTVKGFQESAGALGLTCPLFLTSNDGTLMTSAQAVRLPIRTFSSGPTNSMRGANFLAGLKGARARETALVVDVGGTTTEVGVLLPTGFPRQAGAFHQLCGVRLNFPMPHVESIGLGGGSRIRKNGDKTSVGPDSVGYRITDEALCFGGNTLTATDIIVAAGRGDGVGEPSLVTHLLPEDIAAAQTRMKTMIELVVDTMKTSAADVPLYLVGGGAILVPDQLHGVSHVYRFPHYEAANAVGAACAQISAVVDTFEDTSTKSIAEVQRLVEARAVQRAIENGADPASTVVVESESIPIAYTTGRCRFYVKAAGEWTGTALQADDSSDEDEMPQRSWDATTPVIPATAANGRHALPVADPVLTAPDILAYRPHVQRGEWTLSELDLEWIATGCYILGTGGGGNPATTMLAVRELVRSGARVRVVDIDSLGADKSVCWGGGIGSPEVVLERLDGGDPAAAITALLNFMGTTNCAALAALEIGGSNGMFNMLAGSSRYLDLPIVDGDFMGRAYPTGWQTTVQVMDSGERAEMTLPNAMVSGDGSNMFMTTAKHYKDVDRVLRAGCIEMGTHANVACRPLSRAFCQDSLVRNTVSQSWRLGRAVALATKQSNIGDVGRILVDAVGGRGAARVLFAGKITALGRHIFKGHTYGEITITALAADEDDSGSGSGSGSGQAFHGTMKIPFKNENLLCRHVLPSGEEEVVAGVPDLISVLDAQNGLALGTPEYKYGQRVVVLGMAAAPQWTGTQRGLDLGALPAFGYDIPYVALGEYVRPMSVIEEYGA